MTSFSGATFVFVLFRFRLYAFVEAAALRSIALRYAGARIAARVSFLFPFCLFGDYAFDEYFLHHCRFSLYDGEYVVGSFLPNGMIFLPCDHGLDFSHRTGWKFHISLSENSINQTISQAVRTERFWDCK